MYVYYELLAAKVPLDSHESDLYAKVTKESREIIERHRVPESLNVRTFVSAIDGERWFEIAFAFDPFWEQRS